MVYWFEPMHESEHLKRCLILTSDKPAHTWDAKKYEDVHVQECAEGTAMVKKGITGMMEDAYWNSFCFDAMECGYVDFDECVLLAIAMFKRNGYLSLDRKAIFTVRRGGYKHVVEGGDSIDLDYICAAAIAQEVFAPNLPPIFKTLF